MSKRKLREEGRVYGRLTVVSRAEDGKGHKTMWHCECACGVRKVICGGDLRNGSTKSCGCLRRESLGNRSRTHGLESTKLYVVWRNMLKRCNTPSVREYRNYGGRGISVCDEWLDVTTFYRWAKDKWKENLQLDRVDNDGDYTPENCRFVTPCLNVANQRKRQNASGYTGVYERPSGKYYAQITSERVALLLGTYPTAWQACKARNQFIKDNNLPHKIQKENNDL